MITLGFGADTVAGVVRSGAGALICRDGRTTASPPPRVEELTGLAGWRATDEDGVLELAFEPIGRPAVFSDGSREWLCRARGTAAGRAVDCLGHAIVGGEPPRGRRRPGLGRVVAAWLGEDLAVALHARRPARARNHEAEEVDGFLLRGSPPEPHPIEDPRLSTAYGGDGRQPPSVMPRRAGLELWETEDSDYPLRGAGGGGGGGGGGVGG
ncbi:MAG: hypothetical protein ACR2KV_10630, partial [Solirubrobacteraceae bacterium]